MVYFDFDFFNIFPKGKCEIFHRKFELAETFQFGAKSEMKLITMVGVIVKT